MTISLRKEVNLLKEKLIVHVLMPLAVGMLVALFNYWLNH